MSVSNLFSIVVMQGFNGLSSFAVLLLMALGLAIIFGQMGVINMAHGEFLTIGAYTTYLLSAIAEKIPGCRSRTFCLAIVVSFVIAAGIGLARRALHDPAPLQAAARHAAGHLGPQPDHAAGLSVDLRRQGGQRRRCPSG